MKMNVKNALMGVCSVIVLSACSSTESQKVSVLQRQDKILSCQEILLEMNEAEFHKTAAERNRGVSMKNVMMPLGYINTYMSADDAVEAAEDRIKYLDRIYQINQCDQTGRAVNFRQPASAGNADRPVLDNSAFSAHPGEVGYW